MTGLVESYLRTTYRVTSVDPAIDIRIGEPCPALDALLEKHAARTWAFVTAWNPGSKQLDEAENRHRQGKLEAEVKQRGYVFFRGAGIPDDFIEQCSGSSFHVHPSSLDLWSPEESILILGIERSEAERLGRKFGQAAIVIGTSSTAPELLFL